MIGAVAVFVLLAQAQVAQIEGDLGGRLYRAVFGRDMLSAGDLASAPAGVRKRLELFVARHQSFTSRIPSVPNEDPDGKDTWAARRRIERTIVALVAAPGIEADAERFARAVPVWWEYEGRPEGPLEEANFAEDYLKKAPDAAVAPYLYLFIAQRQRIAFETYSQEASPKPPAIEGMKAAARKYRAFIQRARSHADSLVGLIADDLDRQPFLYLKTGRHPRDFDPDT